MRGLCILSALSLAMAACPNQCSGHGWCDENERCVCFKAPGQGLAYVGADCSQRVCPYGVAHDLISDNTQVLVPVSDAVGDAMYVGYVMKAGAPSGASVMRAFLNGGFLGTEDMGLDLRVVSTAGSPNPSITFQWKTNQQKNFFSEVTATATLGYSRATAIPVNPDFSPTGLYIYWPGLDTGLPAGVNAGDRYFLNVSANSGTRFVAENPNTAHQSIECSGRGVCDRVLGACKCVAGYTGDACQRTACPNDCSGHGVCQSEAYFAADAASAASSLYTYGGFDADSAYGCKCDTGFRGADCAQRECPSGPDPVKGSGGAEGMDCSGRGLCDYTTGVCKCFKGFFGERC